MGPMLGEADELFHHGSEKNITALRSRREVEKDPHDFRALHTFDRVIKATHVKALLFIRQNNNLTKTKKPCQTQVFR